MAATEALRAAPSADGPAALAATDERRTLTPSREAEPGTSTLRWTVIDRDDREPTVVRLEHEKGASRQLWVGGEMLCGKPTLAL